jgi:hypothetical protein
MIYAIHFLIEKLHLLSQTLAGGKYPPSNYN